MTTNTESARRAIKVRKDKADSEKLDVNVERINPDLYALNGQIGGDPELRYTENGKAVANVSVAYDVREKKGNDWVSAGVMWVRVNLWGKLAENAATYLHKGDRVVVIGTWHETSWDDKETGEPRTGIEMNARDIGFSMMFADKKYGTDPQF